MDNKFGNGDAGRSCTVDDNFYLPDLSFEKFESVDQGSQSNNSGSVLVVMENRDSFEIFETLLDVKTFRSLDVFKVDGHEVASYLLDGSYLLFGVTGINAQRDDLDASEQFE